MVSLYIFNIECTTERRPKTGIRAPARIPVFGSFDRFVIHEYYLLIAT
jgi:hypothetical protein